MTTLVVQAHPLEDSYSAALLGAVVEGLGAVVEGLVAPRVVRIAEGDDLTAESFAGARSLVAVYPTWWGSLPASLLAGLNDVIGPWVDGPEPAATSPLATLTSITVVTTHGSSKLVNRLQGEPGLQLWKRTVLPLCAPGATFSWRSLYKLDRATESDRTNFLTEARTLA